MHVFFHAIISIFRHFFCRSELRYITQAHGLTVRPVLLRRDWACVVRQQWWPKWDNQRIVLNLPRLWLEYKSLETGLQLQHILKVRNTIKVRNVTIYFTSLTSFYISLVRYLCTSSNLDWFVTWFYYLRWLPLAVEKTKCVPTVRIHIKSIWQPLSLIWRRFSQLEIYSKFT